jgi:hypothetical protein
MTVSKIFPSLLIVGMFGMASQATLAQSSMISHDDSISSEFAKLDKNHDGFLRRSEVPSSLAHLRSYFSEADKNQDGRLTLAEFAASGSAQPEHDLQNDSTRFQAQANRQQGQQWAAPSVQAAAADLHSNSGSH